jgi:hypothetical protein
MRQLPRAQGSSPVSSGDAKTVVAAQGEYWFVAGLMAAAAQYEYRGTRLAGCVQGSWWW